MYQDAVARFRCLSGRFEVFPQFPQLTEGEKRRDLHLELSPVEEADGVDEYSNCHILFSIFNPFTFSSQLFVMNCTCGCVQTGAVGCRKQGISV